MEKIKSLDCNNAPNRKVVVIGIALNEEKMLCLSMLYNSILLKLQKICTKFDLDKIL
ncbi:hypothetical protein QIA30_05445 (plasmid) [Borreliella turdi]|uniref:hypothetical protein n=1 Tax=Borreliella turdi TaxID=57863 RepID=UPI003AF060DF